MMIKQCDAQPNAFAFLLDKMSSLTCSSTASPRGLCSQAAAPPPHPLPDVMARELLDRLQAAFESTFLMMDVTPDCQTHELPSMPLPAGSQDMNCIADNCLRVTVLKL